MKVLFVVNNWGVGGVEANFLSYCDVLKDKDVHFDIYTRQLFSEELLTELSRYGIRMFVETRRKGLLRYIGKYRQINKLAEKYDIIHINGGAGDSFLYAHAIRKKYKDKKIIVHCHTAKPVHNKWSLKMVIMNFVGKALFSNVADYNVACSQDAADWLFNKKTIETHKYEIIPCSIDGARFEFDKEARKQYRKEMNIQDELVVGTVGRMAYQKNPFFIIDILKRLTFKNEKFKFLWIGEGPLYNQVFNKIQKEGLSDYVIFYGNTDQIHKIYSAMDVFILPSVFEGLGIVNVEAQANGLWCLMSSGLPKETNASELAQYLPITDADIWCEAIRQKSSSREMRDMDGYCSKRYAEQVRHAGFDKIDNAEKIYALYQSLL